MINRVTELTGTGSVNKNFHMVDGKSEKAPNKPFFSGDAVTRGASNVFELQTLTGSIAANPKQCLMLGYLPDMPLGEVYGILTNKNFEARIKNGTLTKSFGDKFYRDSDGKAFTPRLKECFAFSNWMLLDKDDYGSNDIQTWSQDVNKVIPGFLNTPRLIVPSNSSRVVVKGSKPESFNKWHCYVQVTNPDDLHGFGTKFLTTAYAKGLGVTDQSSNGHPLYRTIVDCSVWSPERVIYEGKPTVGEGLEVLPFESEIQGVSHA